MAAFRLTNVAEAIIDISPMNNNDAEILLKKKLQDDQSGVADIRDLLTTLEYLPLAITQAAAYIAMRQTRFTISKYLAYLRQDEALLLKDMGDLRRDHDVPNSILQTWQISFNQIKSRDPKAADVLSLMSVLSPQGIPQLLLYRDKKKLDIEDALDTLHDFLLVTPERDGAMFGMHRLVQLATKTWLTSHDEISKWENEALRLLSLSFTCAAGYKNWQHMLLPHAEVVSEYIYDGQTQLLQQATLSTNMAMYFQLQGNYNAALTNIQRVVNVHQRFLKMDDPTLVNSLQFQALFLRRLGRYDEAEAIIRQLLGSLDSQENPLRNDQCVKLKILSSSASVLEERGKYEEAEVQYQLVLKLAKGALGEENIWTLTYMNNLAIVLQRRGKYKEAENMHRQELELSKRIYGESDEATLKTIMNLASALRSRGKFDEAEDMQRTALRKNTLGDEHPSTLRMQYNLAITLKDQGKLSECANLHRQVFATRVKVLGNEHPDVLASRNCVAIALKDSDKYDEAEKMLQTVLLQEESVLGKEHPFTLNTVHLLARLLALQKQYPEASTLHQRALAGRRKVLGPDHPDTKKCLEFNEELFVEMKKAQEEEEEQPE